MAINSRLGIGVRKGACRLIGRGGAAWDAEINSVINPTWTLRKWTKHMAVYSKGERDNFFLLRLFSFCFFQEDMSFFTKPGTLRRESDSRRLWQ